MTHGVRFSAPPAMTSERCCAEAHPVTARFVPSLACTRLLRGLQLTGQRGNPLRESVDVGLAWNAEACQRAGDAAFDGPAGLRRALLELRPERRNPAGDLCPHVGARFANETDGGGVLPAALGDELAEHR